MDSRYSSRGVSSTKSDVHEAIKNQNKGLFPKAFCKILPDVLANNPDYCTAIHADGAGTKSSLAYLYWKETNDLNVWKGIAQDAIVMNIDDLLCIGAVDQFMLSSTIGRNKNRVPGEVIKAVIEGSQAFCELLNKFGIEVHFGGGETADVGDLVRTIIVDSNMSTRLRKDSVIDNANIKEDLVIVGLSSYGQAIYETEYNSGIGSNGLTSARHDLLHHAYIGKYPESYDDATPLDVIYTGTHYVNDNIDSLPITVGKAILSPTRTYAPIIKSILDHISLENISGMVHCSGGGQTKVLNFVDNLHIIKDNLIPCPPLFKLIQATSQTDWKEMYQVFNMGSRFEIYTNSNTADQIIAISNSFNVKAQVIGYTEKATAKKLTIKTEFGTFTW